MDRSARGAYRKGGPPRTTNPSARTLEDAGPAEDPSTRFRRLDPYRVDREWDRYEGTAQRTLFRELRMRFLARHRAAWGWVLDLGSGPGRFLPHVGGPQTRRVALDLSVEALHRVERTGRTHPELVRGDGLRPPFRAHAFQEVVALGNAIGFAGPQADRLWQSAGDLLDGGGHLVLEVVAGPGETSRYLQRLPTSSLPRLLHAPLGALLPRIVREGFAPRSVRRAEPGPFRRFDAARLVVALADRGWVVDEVMAVAPALGAAADRLEKLSVDSVAWSRLLDLEEALGRQPERMRGAAAVLMAASAPAGRTAGLSKPGSPLKL